MDETLTRGYCLLRSEGERRSRPLYFTNDNNSYQRDPSDGGSGEQQDMQIGEPMANRKYRIERDEAAPVDRCSCIYIALLLCGAGFLTPYNSFIAAVDYYQERFPGTTIVFDISLTYICIAFCGVLLNNILVESFSLYKRIMFGYAVSFITMLSLVIMDIAFGLFDDTMAYYVTLIAAAITALGCTAQQSSFYGYTSMLPKRYTQAVMTGESAAGLLSSINRIVTKSLLNDPKTNTIIFFSFAIGLVVFCTVAFSVLRRTEFTMYYVRMCNESSLKDDERPITSATGNNPEEVGLVDILEPGVARDSYGILAIQSPTSSPLGDGFKEATNTIRNGIATGYQNNDQMALESPESPAILAVKTHQASGGDFRKNGRQRRKAYAKHGHVTWWQNVKAGVYNRYQVACKAWPYMLAILLAYFVTLSLFPGIESEVISCKLGSWMPVMLMAVFNLFDFIGKILSSITINWSPWQLVVGSSCRVILVPAMMLCVYPRTGPILSNEGWSVVLSALLGVSNGYFGSVPMTMAPEGVADAQKELTGNIMMLSYIIGLTGGSAVAYLLDDLIGPEPIKDPCLSSDENKHNVTSYLETLANLKRPIDQ